MATASASRFHRIPLVPQLSQRGQDFTTDARLTNGFIDRDPDGETWVYKRYGLQAVSTYGGATGVGLGVFAWRPVTGTAGGVYTITGDGQVAKDGGLLAGTVDTTNSTIYWFNTTLGSPAYMYFSNGVKAYTVASPGGTVVQITDVNYPAVTVPGSAYLDGTLYVMDPQGNIWGSNTLNNPTTWSATNVIKAQAEPDAGIALAKQATYVIAFKQWTTEVFYDAGSPLGSPLLPVANARMPIGCVKTAANAVISVDDRLYFIGSNRNSATGVYVIDNLRMREISTPAVARILEQGATVTVLSWAVRFGGHTYVAFTINVGAVGYTTLVYDITMNAWYQWKESPGLGGTGGMDVSASSFDIQNVQYRMQLSSAGTTTRNFISTQFSDYNGEVVTLDGVTPNFDGGLKVQKVMTRLRLVCSQKSQGALQIRWSDDDYQTWSNWTTISLQQFDPMLTNLGTFRKRAFQFRHQSPTAFRMQAFDAEIIHGAR